MSSKSVIQNGLNAWTKLLLICLIVTAYVAATAKLCYMLWNFIWSL